MTEPAAYSEPPASEKEARIAAAAARALAEAEARRAAAKRSYDATMSAFEKAR